MDFTIQEQEIIKKPRPTDQDMDKIRNNRKLKLLYDVCAVFDLHPTNIFSLEDWAMVERAGGIDLFELSIEEMYYTGGTCDVCEKPWKKVNIKIFDEKKDKDGKILDPGWSIQYYKPSCQCYPRCIYCNRVLIIESKNKLAGCSICGEKGIECWKNRYVLAKDENGNVDNSKKGKWRKCSGTLVLQAPENGYTVMKCTQCDNEIRKEIIV